MILAFDTSGAFCSVAVFDGSAVLAQTHIEMAKGQAEQLFPTIDKTLAAARASYDGLTSISVGIGPGNFTGIRISVSAARGLAMALKKPALGASALEVAAFGSIGAIRVALDARMGRFYCQDFFDGQAVSAPELKTYLPDDGRQTINEIPTHTAAIIARLCSENPNRPTPKPLYLRPADAAPARDQAPIVVP